MDIGRRISWKFLTDWRQVSAMFVVVGGLMGLAYGGAKAFGYMPGSFIGGRLGRVEQQVDTLRLDVGALQRFQLESTADRLALRRGQDDIMATLCFVIEKEYGGSKMIPACVRVEKDGQE